MNRNTPPSSHHPHELLRRVLALPTAPFHEAHVGRFIERFAADRGLRCERDRYGNLYVAYRSGPVERRPIVLEAHMDHPGFHVESVAGGAATLSFLGKVPTVELAGQRLLFCKDGGGEPAAGIVRNTRPGHGFYRPMTVEAEVPAGAAVAAGDFAVFDLTTWRLEGHHLEARAHDDLAQVAATLATLDRLVRERAEAHVIGLFTRAEEVGFIGAYGATEAGLLPRDAVVVVLECSGLPLERGFVVRCGDKSSVFDGWATTRLLQLADEEAARDADFVFTTPVPRRGTCNASLYGARGWVATGLTLPMANYHNWSAAGVRPEVIDLRDWSALVGFLHVVCTRFGRVEDVRSGLRSRTDDLWRQERGQLEETAGRMRGGE